MAEQFTYELKTDPTGMVGRECPKCKTYFKIPLKAAECEDLTCPFCGVKSQCKKFTTHQQVDYINSIIFHRDGCPIVHNDYSKMPPCHDYIDVPAKNTYLCDVCGKCFGLDNKSPEICPFCDAARQHLHPDSKCDYVPPEK